MYAVVVTTLVVFFLLGVMSLRGVRAFVAGESSWSKAQKQGAACLQQYAFSADESDFECYSSHRETLLSGARARQELMKPNPVMDSAYAYMIGARNHPDDVRSMGFVFRSMGWHPVMREVSETWAEGDREIAAMHEHAMRLREQVRSGAHHDDPSIAATLADIRATDNRLTVLEYQFSEQLGTGARMVSGSLITTTIIAALALLGLVTYVSLRWISAWQQANQLASAHAARMHAVAGAAAGVGSTFTVEELDTVLRVAIAQVIDGDMLTFGIYDAASHSFDFLGGKADGMVVPAARVSAAGTPSERFLTDRSSILTLRAADPAAQGAYQHGTARRSESVIRAAMYSQARLLGMIAVHSYKPEHYDHNDVEVVETLAAVAASAIQRFESAREQQAAEENLRQSEEQLAQARKMEAVGLLAGGIAHDFNNLLTAIKGNADMLVTDASLSSDLRDHVSEIAAASDRAAALTNQLLAFSRRQVLQPRVVNLNTMVSDISLLIGRLIGEDLHLVTSLDHDLANVRADPHQMEQVILNLVLNSRDAMTEHGTVVIETCNVVVVEVDPTLPDVPPGAYVRLSVQDTGSGIEPDDRERIFEPFFTTKPVGKGTGLGLSTVYGIVKQTGGYICVQSAPGAGTTMQIFLQPTNDEVDAPLPHPATRKQSAPVLDTTVLIVEDETTVRTLLTRVLTRQGYEVIEARSGEEALEVLGSDRHIDLLLTDTVMPGMSGVALSERAVVMRPGLAVLHMSGYTEDEVFRRGLSRRGEAFLQKPFSPAVLLSGVAEALAANR